MLSAFSIKIKANFSSLKLEENLNFFFSLLFFLTANKKKLLRQKKVFDFRVCSQNNDDVRKRKAEKFIQRERERENVECRKMRENCCGGGGEEVEVEERERERGKMLFLAKFRMGQFGNFNNEKKN